LIVIVYPQCHGVGGIARYLDGLLAHLPEGTPPVVLVTGRPAAEPGGPVSPPSAPSVPAARQVWRGVEVIELPLGSLPGALWAWTWRVRRTLGALRRRGPITAINLHLPPLVPALAVAGGVRDGEAIVVTAHTTYAGLSGRWEAATGQRHFDSSWGRMSMAARLQLERWIFGLADTVVCLTPQARQELATYGRRDRIAVIPNGVDAEVFSPRPDAGAPPDLDVLFAGRLEPRKGSRALPAVCARLLGADPRLRIGIVGTGEDEAWLRQALAPLAPQVQLLGRVPMSDMVATYRRARVYASTSYYEGLPGTCLEAMACALPVVVWDRAFYRGLVVEDVTGRVVPVDDAEAMAGRIRALLQDAPRAAAMGRRARQWVQRRYAWQRLAREVVQACQRPMPRAALVQVAP
jgi:glycosyltransferase involved in cell wall biosynthesis